MPPNVATTFHVQLLKRDYFVFVEGMGYINTHDCPFTTDAEVRPQSDLSASTVIEWTDTHIDLDAFETNLELLAQERRPPHVENPTSMDHEVAATQFPRLRYNEVEFIPFLGWYSTRGHTRCFASYNFDIAICFADPDNWFIPDDEAGQVAMRHLELSEKVRECLAFFDEHCPLAGLLEYSEAEVYEPDPEPPMPTDLGRTSETWMNVDSVEFDYDYEDEMITQTPSAVLADTAYDEWKAWKRKKSSKKDGKRKRRRRRRR